LAFAAFEHIKSDFVPPLPWVCYADDFGNCSRENKTDLSSNILLFVERHVSLSVSEDAMILGGKSD